MARNINMLN